MHVRTANNRIKATQHGFSLVEVLVALIIMSVGMLGIAGLYVQSMQAGRTSMLRHNAVTLAGDVADRIRSNPRAGDAYTNADGADHGCVAGDADCDEIEMAEHDILLWQAQAKDTMPNGLVTITIGGDPDLRDYTIAITWDEPGEVMDYTVTIPVFGI